MKQLLLPNKFKIPGWIMLVIATAGWIYLSIANEDIEWLSAKMPAIYNSDLFGKSKVFTMAYNNITDELFGVMFIIGAFFVGFSREKKEDEFIANLRLTSLLWSVYVSYFLLVIAMLFVYGEVFLSVMIYNMFTVLIIFIIRFNYILYRSSKSLAHEK